MKKLFFLVCAVGAFIAIRDHMPARVHGGRDSFQVRRLAPSGPIVREDFRPKDAPYLAVYHGAKWCGPCQRFSPTLCSFYHDADKSTGRFQLFMASYDHSDSEMEAYMREHQMEFPAIPHADAGGWGVSTGPGIPNLVIIETGSGRVIASSFEGSNYVGCDRPLEVLRRIAALGHP
jgi:thiol-disulfide isomerase/thioredoxin